MCRLFLVVICCFPSLFFAFHIEKDTLDNGFTILLNEAHKIPMVELKVIIKAGSFFDPAGKEGLANLVVRMLLRGTQFHTGDEIIERIENLGADFDASATEDYAQVSVRALSKDLPLLLEMISECITKPQFDTTEFRRLQKRTYSEIVSKLDDPFYIGQVKFRSLLFGACPLNHDPLGFDSTINDIKISDIKDFYNRYYAPNNTIIVLVGDFSRDSIMELTKKYFADWQRKEIPVQTSEVPVISGKKGLIIKKELSQSYIFLGFPGPDYNAKDWIPTRIMNYILGGSGLTSRLATEIREKRGLAYSVFSFFDRFNYGGYFIAGVQTKNESANEAVNLIIQELKTISQGISTDELNHAKHYYKGNFPLRFDTYREMADFITRIEIEGLGLDYADKFDSLISAVGLKDIKESARKYLHPDDFCLVIVGDIDEKMIQIEDINWIRY
ncbi:MAG: M16 family metallopeptidase [bacterium]